nr:neural-cadherin [Crepidula fornicata]
MAAETWPGERLRSSVFVLVFLSSIALVSARRSFLSHKHDKVHVSYFPNSPHSFGVRGKLSESELDKTVDVLQLESRDFLSRHGSQLWENFEKDLHRQTPHFRQRRAVTAVSTSKEVPETTTGMVIDLQSNLSLSGRQYSINSTSSHPEMFEVSSDGQLRVKDGYRLDYEDASMRTISFVVHATSFSDPTDVYEITATLTVTNVDEAPVFVSEPQPYWATVLTNPGPDKTLIVLQATDPEGQTVHYTADTVSPSTFNDQIKLFPFTEGGVAKCALRTVGSKSFLPEGQILNVKVTARDATNGGQSAETTVKVQIGVRPPQFFQDSYQGAMPEKNRAQQTVYKLGKTEELQIEWKTFQAGPVTLTLSTDSGQPSGLFATQRGFGQNTFIVCKQILDYEVVTPKVQQLTLTLTQRVGSVDLVNTVPVSVAIEDTNDNRPLFDQSQYLYTVKENFLVGENILTVMARDADTGQNAQIDYTLLNTDNFDIVTELNSTTSPPTYQGKIKVKQALDYDRRQGPYYTFQVLATDRGLPPQSSTTNVRITVTNVNDEYPQFLNPNGTEYSVSENAGLGHFIAQIVATDKDGDKVTYRILPSPSSSKFAINSNTGVLTLQSAIDDTDNLFQLAIEARDDGSCCQETEGPSSNANDTTVFVQVTGVNKERPDFTQCGNYNPAIDEHSAPGTPVLQVSAVDNDRGPNGVVTYILTQSQDLFDIDSSTGEITVKADIDRETNDFIQVTVTGRDGGNPRQEGWCTFRVTINDINDHSPSFDKDSYMANITIVTKLRVSFISVRAYDDDVGDNAIITYSLPYDAEGRFGIIPENGFIYLQMALTSEHVGQSFSLTAMAQDEGSPPRNTTVAVVVNVKSGDTKAPQWDRNYNSETILVDETVPARYFILNMTCVSNIENTRVEFQLIRGDGRPSSSTEFFLIEWARDSNTVTVLASGKFDYFKAKEHIIRIRCLNEGPVTLYTEVNPKVVLRDTNNKVPQFLGLNADGRYNVEVQENKPVGTSVATIEARDLDSTYPFNKVTFSISAGGENFAISPGAKNNTATIRTRREFDRETKGFYTIDVTAVDGAITSRPDAADPNLPNSETKKVNVKIIDVNDNDPYFDLELYHVSVRESYYINELIDPAIAVQDPDESDRGRHTYQIISGNGIVPTFGVRNGLGNLFLLRHLDYESGDKNFLLELRASDGIHNATTKVNVTVIDVNDNSPVFTQSYVEVTDIEENDPSVPRLLDTMTATDADVDRDNQIRYSLEGSSFVVSEYFSIEAVSGRLYLIKPLDRDPPEGRPNYQFTVKAADEAVDPNYGYATVSVRPLDVNDNSPEFVTEPLEGSVPEHSPRNTPVSLIQARDKDFGNNSTILFSITGIQDGAGVDRADYFHFREPQRGELLTNTTADNLDRETQSVYLVTILLKDMGTPRQRETSGVFTVRLSDINDQPPVFEKKIYRTQMSESQQSGEVIRVIANDADVDENAAISYVLAGQGDSQHFSVKTIDNEGSIQIESHVDYEIESQRFFNLTVKAQDNAEQEDTCYVEIEVLDFNDFRPDITPKTVVQNVSEAAPPGTLIATFSATDGDASQINSAFEFSISRESDPRRHFFIDPMSGEVKIRRRLDRETTSTHLLTILAIDKGDPPLTGTASLTVVVEDVNDNYPTFRGDYRPVVMEGEGQGVRRVVQEIFAKDPDASPYGAPFLFEWEECPGANCDKFSFQFNPAGDGNNGTATIFTDQEFDRETQKYYYLPIVMSDMRGTGSSEAKTGTNTLTVTIGDINDQPMGPGTQNMFVYNYKGLFGPVDIGRVYVKDKDDWDLPDKTFTFVGPDWMKHYFTVDPDTGMVKMQKNVPPNTATTPYRFTVTVRDSREQKTVTSTVSVVVQELSEEAVRNSGAARFKGISAEDFIKVPEGENQQSPFTKFQGLLARALNTDTGNVQIISVQDVEGDGGYTDVRYSVHGSPYYPSSQIDSVVVLNKTGFEQDLGLNIAEVPIDACAEEVFEGGCYNYMDITGKPALVNANGTSFVGVEVYMLAREGCRALHFPDPNECSGDYCYHGGTCVQDVFGVLSCENCPSGFDGPRCQQLRHSFDGKSFAMYPTLEQCEDSETSIEFITQQSDGILLYNGPMTAPAGDQPHDFLALELSGGMPVLHLDHGSGSTSLALTGRDNNSNSVISSLADGKWHKIDIVRKGRSVEMIVDDCRAAGPLGSESTAPDTKPCSVRGTTPGANSFLNVATLLQVGGRASGHTYPGVGVIGNTKFNGCVKNLVHNSKIYDLHYKPTPSVPSGENGCRREDDICGNTCGPNGMCTASFSPSQATCTCKPGWRGTSCNAETAVRDLQTNSYLQWQLKTSTTLPTYMLDVQLMFRTWDTTGVLFTVSTSDSSKRVTMEIKDGDLQVSYTLGDKDNILHLNNSQVGDGQWHLAKFHRVMHRVTLTLDAGEGRNHMSQRDPSSSVYMTVGRDSPMYGGASVTDPSGATVIDWDLTDTCVRDFRLNGQYLPIVRAEDALSEVAELVKEQNVQDGCDRDEGCPPPVCPANEVCVPRWGRPICNCAPGYHETDSGGCISDCVPNPCFQGVACSIENGTVLCDCSSIPPWMGALCNVYPQEEQDSSVGIAGATIGIIIASILIVILLALLAVFLVMRHMRNKDKDDFDKFVVEEDADFDIRENVMFYDEEGAGEEDQDAFDLSKLPTQESEMIKPATDMPRHRELPRGKGVPDDRPDVGDVLHDRLGDADDDTEAPPYDTLIAFADEGAGSDAGSLSSLGSSSSDASHDYDYLNDWGPKFAKLADMYGAGQE